MYRYRIQAVVTATLIFDEKIFLCSFIFYFYDPVIFGRDLKWNGCNVQRTTVERDGGYPLRLCIS